MTENINDLNEETHQSLKLHDTLPPAWTRLAQPAQAASLF